LFDGYVGIGVSDPVEFLHLEDINTRIQIKDTTTGDDSRFVGGVSSNNGGFLLLYDDENTNNVRISSYNKSFFNGGNVGIGTDDPEELLHVDGNVKIGGTIENVGSMIWGDSSTAVWSEYKTPGGGDADTLMLHSGGVTHKLTSFDRIVQDDYTGMVLFREEPTNNLCTRYYNYDTTATYANGFEFWTREQGESVSKTYGLYKSYFSVLADSSRLNYVACDSLTVGDGVRANNFTTNGTNLFTYKDTTFYDSLFENGSYKVRTLCELVKSGRVMVLRHPEMTATLTGGYGLILRGMPSDYEPVTYSRYVVSVVDNSSTKIGHMEYTGSSFTLFSEDMATFTSGTGGISDITITWLVDE
jgi:hypothetical protein